MKKAKPKRKPRKLRLKNGDRVIDTGKTTIFIPKSIWDGIISGRIKTGF